MKDFPNRWKTKPHPVPVFRKRQEVKVQMGAGWSKGTVQQSDRDGCSVWLGREQRSVRVTDARNIFPL